MRRKNEVPDKEEYKILECSWCGRAYDRETKRYVRKPDKVLSHGICDTCYRKAIASLMLKKKNK